jgi:GDPmannose 4,6-dehydratase
MSLGSVRSGSWKRFAKSDCVRAFIRLRAARCSVKLKRSPKTKRPHFGRRGETFVTRKISRAVAAIKQGLQKELFLGNLEAKRDWGYAPEYVEAMWRILQHDGGDDFVVATGETHTVREFAETAFAHVDLDWKKYVKHDPRYERPAEVDLLIGDSTKVKKVLGWEPKVHFQDLVRIMVDADMELLSREAPRRHLGKLP